MKPRIYIVPIIVTCSFHKIELMGYTFICLKELNNWEKDGVVFDEN